MEGYETSLGLGLRLKALAIIAIVPYAVGAIAIQAGEILTIIN